MTRQYSKLASRIVRSEIREILKWTRKPGVISFGGGLPDASLFPIKELTEITAKVLAEKGFLALQYGPSEGENECRTAFFDFMAEHGDSVAEDEMIVTSSAQQGLDLLSMLYLDPGINIVMELPSYLGGIQAFRRSGALMHGIPMDDEGMNIDMLLQKLKALKEKKERPAFIYTIPDFQNPSGITMSLERRKQLVDISREWDILLVEDSPYREISFSGKMLPSIWSLANGHNVIMLKTLSKMLFPGMRLGWLCAPSDILDKIIMIKQSVDLCTPAFNQLIIAEYFHSGKMKETIIRARECYKPKRQKMLDSLEKYMPQGISWSKPDGGMFLWLTCPEHIDTFAIFMKAIERNVAYVIGRPFHCDGSGKNTMRLNYSFPSMEQIDEGISNLAAVLREAMNSDEANP